MEVISKINLHEIQVLPDCFQVREKTKRNVVYDYKVKYQNGVAMPPLVVARLKGVYYLCDGFHRLFALQELGRQIIDAEVIDVKNEHEIRWTAARLNGQHGLQLTSKEKHLAFDCFIKAGKHKRNKSYLSIREIAKEFGMWNQSTVNRTLKSRYPAIFAKMKREPYGDDGRDRDNRIAMPNLSLTQQTLDNLKEVAGSMSALHGQGRKQVIKALKACLKDAERLESGGEHMPKEEAEIIKLFIDDENPEKESAIMRAENDDY